MRKIITDMEEELTVITDMEEELTVITDMKKANRPITLKFNNVVYKIITENGGLFRGKDQKVPEEKVILNGITGAVMPKEMLAMLGPSGSGKTTLLNALGGRLKGNISGIITYNGKPFSNAMNRNTGFVTQDDKFHPHLTVIETLIFSALLRLPKTLTQQEKIKHAEAVMNQLGLAKCKNTIIGGPFVRGVSGGERKRVSIGQEILINPSLIVLDEPTSGLDSRSAHQVVSILLELAKEGRTVLMSIHQPSSRLFYMFHKVLLLSDGNPLYFGKGEEAMDYFSHIGFTSSVAINPADFLLDLADGVYLDESSVDKKLVDIKQDLFVSYKSNLAKKPKEELPEIGKPFLNFVDDKQFGRWSTTWGQQFLVLLQRDLQERKHASFSRLNIVQVLIFSFVCGVLWWQSSTAHLQDQMGFLFFCSVFWSVRPFYSSVPTFPLEKMMLVKERSSSMYRLSSYFIAKTVGDLPMELALPTIFVTITYWMVGLKPTIGHFFKTLLVVLYSVLVSQGIGLALGAVFMNINAAITFGAIVIETFFLAGGYYVQNVPRFISWIKYVSHTYYTYKLLLGSQYKTNDLYRCGIDATCTVGSYPAIEKIGLGNAVISFLALSIMLVGYRLIAYVALIKNI